MKIVFVYGNRLSSKLTKLFTGSNCYHVAFTDGVHLWDMHFIRRRRLWSAYAAKNVVLVDCPCDVTAEYLNHKLDTSDETYGWRDYVLFAARPIYHLFGRSTRNVNGTICSEMVADDLIANGWPVRFDEVPSPADLEAILLANPGPSTEI